MIDRLEYYINLFSSCSEKMNKLNNNMAELMNAAPANLVVYIILINVLVFINCHKS